MHVGKKTLVRVQGLAALFAVSNVALFAVSNVALFAVSNVADDE
jgi:hypothetical protein